MSSWDATLLSTVSTFLLCVAKTSSSCLLHRTSFKLRYSLFQTTWSFHPPGAHNTYKWPDSQKVDHAQDQRNKRGLSKGRRAGRSGVGTWFLTVQPMSSIIWSCCDYAAFEQVPKIPINRLVNHSFILPPTLGILEDSWWLLDLLRFWFFLLLLVARTERKSTSLALKNATMNGCFDWGPCLPIRPADFTLILRPIK